MSGWGSVVVRRISDLSNFYSESVAINPIGSGNFEVKVWLPEDWRDLKY